MRTHIAAAVALLAAPLLAACGSDDGTSATDRGDRVVSPMPTEVPAARGPVHTAGLATVLDTGRPELCLGPVAESQPPQCSGPPIARWRWADRQGLYDHRRGVRWGSFWVAGTWDGDVFTLREAVGAALYDPVMDEPTELPTPAQDLTDLELDGIAQVVGDLPGAQGAAADTHGHVLVDVVYDDGSLQAWADEAYGAGVVIVTSLLVDEA